MILENVAPLLFSAFMQQFSDGRSSEGLLSSVCLLSLTFKTDAAPLRPNIMGSKVEEVGVNIQISSPDALVYIY